MTADSTPLPGESASGRHRPARLFPSGIEVRHAIARAGYRFTTTHHTHGGAA